jgi:nucleotide-binding universal stress UspA family protein
MIKDVLVSLDLDGQVATRFAISVARAFEAHLTAIAFSYEAPLPAYVAGRVAVDLIEAERKKRDDAVQNAVAEFNASAQRAGVAAESHLIAEGMAQAADRFGKLARGFDIAVLSQPRPGRSPAQQLIFEAALFESGRPLLIAPYIQRDEIRLDRVMVCWDGSRNAARAVGDAMPFLALAKEIEIVIVTGREGESDEIAGADIARHLARHRLRVELRQIVVPDLDVATTILSHAADAGSDLMIMGGYGHSRVRELILGGATRGILSAMTIPTLMSH